ncbi:hypothetical protein [Nocardia wallacei]|uniref:hypothetical protein n=1 Tax=Nocardia wallacei TaxID=480035 RepID=UPI0024544671|nr:hypothetical protein [Nocardia wallacei]
MLHFVEEVSARYGSLDAFFAQLHTGVCDADEEPTVQLPIVTDYLPAATAWSASDLAARQTPPPSGGKHRKTAAAAWARLTGRP